MIAKKCDRCGKFYDSDSIKTNCTGIITGQSDNTNDREFYDLCSDCFVDFKEWINNPNNRRINWRNVPIDTSILVKDYIDDEWEHRCFAGYYNGKVYAWNHGFSSSAIRYEVNKPLIDYATIWNYVKLDVGKAEGNNE